MVEEESKLCFLYQGTFMIMRKGEGKNEQSLVPL